MLSQDGSQRQRPRLAIVVYNTLTFIEETRRLLVLHVLASCSTSVVLLTGTRIINTSMQDPYYNEKINGFLIFHFGYVTMANKCAGVSIALLECLFPLSCIVGVWGPKNRRTMGRWGAVRCKQGNDNDACFIVAYFPPAISQKKNRIIFDAMLLEIQLFLDALPARCIPVLGGDLNARFGFERDIRGCWRPSAKPCIGDVARENENLAGSLLRPQLAKRNLSLINTSWDAGDTYFDPNSTHKSRIDYLVLPNEFITDPNRISCCKVFHKEGAQMQKIQSRFRADHRPLFTCVDLRLHFITAKSTLNGIVLPLFRHSVTALTLETPFSTQPKKG